MIMDSWPGQARSIYNDHDRFTQTYFSTFKGLYFTGDGACRDEDGYYWITGRVDDVLNVSGHRMGTAEIESAVVTQPAQDPFRQDHAPHPAQDCRWRQRQPGRSVNPGRCRCCHPADQGQIGTGRPGVIRALFFHGALIWRLLFPHFSQRIAQGLNPRWMDLKHNVRSALIQTTLALK